MAPRPIKPIRELQFFSNYKKTIKGQCNDRSALCEKGLRKKENIKDSLAAESFIRAGFQSREKWTKISSFRWSSDAVFLMSSSVCTFQPTRLELVKEQDTPVKISCIKFCVPRAEDVAKTSVARVTNRELYTQPLRKPAAGGALDLRLGPSDKNGQCQTCGLSLASCVGHFGDIPLAFPVFHLGYFKATHFILQCVCKVCSRVLLSKEHIAEFRRKLQSPSTVTLLLQTVLWIFILFR
jgi:hypothetical protein